MKPSGLGEKNLQGTLFLVNGFFSRDYSDEMVTQLHFHLTSFFLSDGKIQQGQSSDLGHNHILNYFYHF